MSCQCYHCRTLAHWFRSFWGSGPAFIGITVPGDSLPMTIMRVVILIQECYRWRSWYDLVPPSKDCYAAQESTSRWRCRLFGLLQVINFTTALHDKFRRLRTLICDHRTNTVMDVRIRFHSLVKWPYHLGRDKICDGTGGNRVYGRRYRMMLILR